MLKYWLLGLVATAIAYATTPWITRLARRVGAIAVGDDRRIHEGRVPSLGGLSVLLGLAVALAVGAATDDFVFAALALPGRQAAWLLAGLLVAVACGIADDIWKLEALPKLAFQAFAGVLVLLAGYGIGGITNPLSGETVSLGWLAAPVTLLWVVGVANAFNLIDGLDGLAAGVGLIASATLFVISLGSGQVEVAVVAIALAGALLGFLPYNFHPARIFLGDSGALLIGFLLAVLSIHALQKGATAVVIATPILALGLPIADTALAMARRLLGAFTVVRADPDPSHYRFVLLRRPSILRGDRDHIHHRLLGLGLTQRRAVLVLYAVCCVFNLLAFMAVRARGPDLALLISLPAIATWVAIRKLGYAEVALLERGTLLPLFDLPVFNRRALHALLDAGFVAASFGTAVVVTGAAGPAARQQLLASLVLITAVKLSVFVYTGLYRRPYRVRDAGDARVVVRSLLTAEIVALIAVSVVFDLPQPAIAIVLLDFYLSSTLVAGARVSFQLLENLAGATPLHPIARPLLVYGTGDDAASAVREILANAQLGYEPIGLVDDNPELWGSTLHGLPVYGGIQQLEALFARLGPCDLVVTGAALSAEALAHAQQVCARHAARVLRFRLVFDSVSASTSAPQPPRRALG